MSLSINYRLNESRLAYVKDIAIAINKINKRSRRQYIAIVFKFRKIRGSFIALCHTRFNFLFEKKKIVFSKMNFNDIFDRFKIINRKKLTSNHKKCESFFSFLNSCQVKTR